MKMNVYFSCLWHFLLYFSLTATLCFTAACGSAGGGEQGTSLANSNANRVNGKQITYQTDTVTKQRLAYKDKQPFTGIVETFHTNGNTFTETSYASGVKSGSWAIYHENGKTFKTGQTENGIKNGVFYEWYPNGQKKYEQPYLNGKKHGKWLSWYESGQKWTARDFEDDTINGNVFVWDTDGTLAKEYVYAKGQLISRKQHLVEE